MIQGLHASSVVFADVGIGSGGFLATMRRWLQGIDSAGYPVRLHGDEYRLRLGQVHLERRDLVAQLHLESQRVPFQAQLSGTVRLQDVHKQSRTKVVFEGRCARNFGTPSPASTEAVRLLANDSSRALLDLLVTAMERPSNLPGELAAIGPPTRRAAGISGKQRKPGTRGTGLHLGIAERPPNPRRIAANETSKSTD